MSYCKSVKHACIQLDEFQLIIKCDDDIRVRVQNSDASNFTYSVLVVVIVVHYYCSIQSSVLRTNQDFHTQMWCEKWDIFKKDLDSTRFQGPDHGQDPSISIRFHGPDHGPDPSNITISGRAPKSIPKTRKCKTVCIHRGSMPRVHTSIYIYIYMFVLLLQLQIKQNHRNS